MKKILLGIFMVLIVVAFAMPVNAERAYFGVYDLYVTHDLELKEGVTFTGDGWDLTRSFELPLGAAITNGTPIAADGTTNPGTATNDNLAAIVWTSPEVTPVQWTFRLPADYSSGLNFRVLVSASSNTQAYDWQLYVNKDDTIFDAAAFGQDIVHQTIVAVTTMNEVLTFSPDATAIADLAAGNYVTFDVWRYNHGDYGAGNAEVKGVTVLYESTR